MVDVQSAAGQDSQTKIESIINTLRIHKMQDSSTHLTLQNQVDLAKDLEELLLVPKNKSSDWQTATAKLTALAHTKTLAADTDDFEYLRLLSLCRWAQKVGVTEAKKKNLHAIRYRTITPPPLESLGRIELISAALDLMVSLRGNWCKEYISAQLLNDTLDKKSLINLLHWAEKTTDSSAEFFELILGTFIGSKANEKLSLLVIKDVTARVKFSQNISAEKAADDFLKIAQFVNKCLVLGQQKKIGSALINSLKIALSEVRIAHPSVLVRGPFFLAMQSIQEELSKTSFKKTALELTSQQLGPTLSLLGDLCLTGGKDGVVYAKLVLPSIKNSYKNFEKLFNEVARTNAALAHLKEGSSIDVELNLEDTAISIYARLLPAWHDFFSSQSDREKLALLNSDLLEAAKLNGVEFLANSGDVLAFDPVAHKYDKEGQSKTTNVRVLTPAVIFRRTNDTYRIILPAIVSAI